MTTATLSLLVVLVAAPAVDNVVVYADRAQVTRTTTATCTTAPVSFGELPAALDARTLRARASGKVEVIGVSSRLVRLDANADARIRDLERDIDVADARLGVIDDAIGLQQARLQQSERYQGLFRQAAAEQMSQARTDLGRWQSALSLMRNERRIASKKLVELGAERRKQGRARELLQRRLDHLRPTQQAEARAASVTLACHGAGKVTVSLSYVVPGATWRPEYDLRYLPSGKGRVGSGTVELTVAAVVQQATGEDWSDVQLVLSTAKPRLGAETPKPAPLFVTGYEQEKGKVLVQSTEERKQLRGPARPSGGEAAADIEDRGQSFVLTLPRRVTVAADGRPYWFPIDVRSAKAEAKLVAVPKLKPFVYQVVQLNNPATHPLVGGRVHVYRRGSYVGDTRIEYLAPGEPMEVSLGIDEELRVERDELHKKNRGSGALSSTKHMERAYRVRVTNRSKERASVELRENLPVSKVEEVKVELLTKKTTAGYALDKHRGFLTWQLDIASGKRATTNLAYIIHLPDSWQVH